MAKHLPIDERLELAAIHVVRARIFYDIWRYCQSDETRPQIIRPLNDYGEFFRFDSHAHFLSFIVYIAGLFEVRRDTINFPQLIRECEVSKAVAAQTIAEARDILARSSSLTSKVFIIRSNLYAHRSASLSYTDVFAMAKVTPNELRELTEMALQMANRLLFARGLQEQVFHPLPLEDVEAMLSTLAKGGACVSIPEGSHGRRGA